MSAAPTRRLRDRLAPRLVPVILANLTARYPYHDSHLVKDGEAPHDPSLAHPAFGNSFDWHSSVHSHWTAVQLLEHFDRRPGSDRERLARLEAILVEHLSSERIAAEAAYLAAHASYERPYGWAWAMMLAQTAQNASRATIRGCTPQLRTLAQLIADLSVDWLDRMPEPVRHGVHSNTAFALGLFLDAARQLGMESLERTIGDRARRWFEDDRGWPERWERSGHDFLSPGLAQADLMRRLLPQPAFAEWWNRFLPALSPSARILSPVAVPDVADGQIVHLHGLNLSRAGMLARIACALHAPPLLGQARRLYRASVEQAVSGDYLATHWLATYAWDAAVGIDG